MSRVIVIGIDVVRLDDILSTVVVRNLLVALIDVVPIGVVAGHTALDSNVAGAFEHVHMRRHTSVLEDTAFVHRDESRRDGYDQYPRGEEQRELWVSSVQRVDTL